MQDNKIARLTLPLPPSTNRFWRHANGRTYVSAEAKAYKNEVAWIARTQGIQDPLTGPVHVRIRVYRKQKSGDLDNRIKVVLDSLNGILWTDDSQIVYIEAHRFDDKHNPRLELEVWEE